MTTEGAIIRACHARAEPSSTAHLHPGSRPTRLDSMVVQSDSEAPHTDCLRKGLGTPHDEGVMATVGASTHAGPVKLGARGHMSKSKPAADGTATGRVSPTAPESKSASVQAWKDATRDPNFREAVKAGLEDVKAGRTRPWSEIRRRTA